MTVAQKKTMRLENKIGIVTAAASGMGRADALRFAGEGASVAVVILTKLGSMSSSPRSQPPEAERSVLPRSAPGQLRS
jgi:NAD(P)-dependent dehydrogenase (short-subunit alcohol dehydrogenase family)